MSFNHSTSSNPNSSPSWMNLTFWWEALMRGMSCLIRQHVLKGIFSPNRPVVWRHWRKLCRTATIRTSPMYRITSRLKMKSWRWIVNEMIQWNTRLKFLLHCGASKKYRIWNEKVDILLPGSCVDRNGRGLAYRSATGLISCHQRKSKDSFFNHAEEVIPDIIQQGNTDSRLMWNIEALTHADRFIDELTRRVAGCLLLITLMTVHLKRHINKN